MRVVGLLIAVFVLVTGLSISVSCIVSLRPVTFCLLDNCLTIDFRIPAACFLCAMMWWWYTIASKRINQELE